MTDLATRIADARGRAVRSLNIKLQLVPNNFEPQEAHPSLAKDQLIIDMADEIDRLTAEVDWWKKEGVKLLQQKAALTAQLEKAREALEPFAQAADSYNQNKHHDNYFIDYEAGVIRAHHLRAAARVHAEIKLRSQLLP